MTPTDHVIYPLGTYRLVLGSQFRSHMTMVRW